MNTFESLLETLCAKRIRFLLVGGLAVELCGFTRTTLDVDILVDDTPDNLQLLLETLKQFGEGTASELNPDDFTPSEGCIRIIEDFPLDIFTRMSGRTYGDLLSYSETYTLRSVELKYVGVDGLLLLKSGSVRAKDQIDVLELRKIKDRQDR